MKKKIGLVFVLLLLPLLAAQQLYIPPFTLPATTCTNQFIRSIAVATGVGTCATVGSSDLAASLSFTTPNINVATATSVNKITITAPATSATLTIQDGTTLTYAQGTWTPTINGSTTAGTGQTYSVQTGSYEQIGRQVRASFNLTITGFGTATGNAQVRGLPVSASGTGNDIGTCFFGLYATAGLAALNYGLIGFITEGTGTVNIHQNGGAASSALTLTQLSASSSQLIGTCIYHT